MMIYAFLEICSADVTLRRDVAPRRQQCRENLYKFNLSNK